jgi:hypothetical protein
MVFLPALGGSDSFVNFDRLERVAHISVPYTETIQSLTCMLSVIYEFKASSADEYE